MSLAQKAMAMEAAGWRSLWSLLTRRPRVRPGADAAPYVGAARTVLVVFIALSAIEVVVVDLILHPWPVPRVIALVLGIWGVLFMAGFAAALVVNPHEVGPDALRVRDGALKEVVVPWGAVDRVTRSATSYESTRSVQVQEGPDGATVCFTGGSQTNIRVDLAEPVTADVPGGPVQVRAVRLWVDDAPAFMAAARRHIAAFDAREDAREDATPGTREDTSA